MLINFVVTTGNCRYGSKAGLSRKGTSNVSCLTSPHFASIPEGLQDDICLRWGAEALGLTHISHGQQRDLKATHRDHSVDIPLVHDVFCIWRACLLPSTIE
eukprot:1315967-Amphidinium_carterae.1